MSRFSASDAALTGFRLARERPKVILVWAALQFVVQILWITIMVTMGGQAFTEFLALAQSPNPDQASIMAAYEQLAPMYAVIFPLMLVYYAIALPAAYRVVLRPGESAFGFVRVGADEARQMIVNIVIGVLLLVLYFVAALATALIVGGVVGGLAAAGVVSGAGGAVVGFLVGVPLFLAIWLPVAVRLSLAGPQTLAERRIRLFESWALTRGQFWNMLGCYLLAAILAVVVTLLGMVVVFAAAAILGGGMDGLSTVMRPNLTSLAGYFTPLMIVYLIMMSVVSAMSMAITLTPSAVIYRDLAESAA